MHIGARSATVIAFAPGAPIVEEGSGGYFRGHNRLRSCSLARRGDLRRRGALPLLTLLCLFGAPFCVRSNEEAGSSTWRLRPPSPVPHSKAILMDGAVSTSAKRNWIRNSACPSREDRRRCVRRRLSKTRCPNGVLARPKTRSATVRRHASPHQSLPVRYPAVGGR